MVEDECGRGMLDRFPPRAKPANRYLDKEFRGKPRCFVSSRFSISLLFFSIFLFLAAAPENCLILSLYRLVDIPLILAECLFGPGVDFRVRKVRPIFVGDVSEIDGDVCVAVCSRANLECSSGRDDCTNKVLDEDAKSKLS